MILYFNLALHTDVINLNIQIHGHEDGDMNPEDGEHYLIFSTIYRLELFHRQNTPIFTWWRVSRQFKSRSSELGIRVNQWEEAD